MLGISRQFIERLRVEGELGLEIWRLARSIGFVVLSAFVIFAWYYQLSSIWETTGTGINAALMGVLLDITCVVSAIFIYWHSTNTVRVAKRVLSPWYREILLNGKLLAIVLSETAAQDLPDLLGPPKQPLLFQPLFPGPAPELATVEDRIVALIRFYPACCKRLVLQPYPPGYVTVSQIPPPIYFRANGWWFSWVVGIPIAKLIVVDSHLPYGSHSKLQYNAVANVLRLVIAGVLEQST